jgi:hypothetical protein
VAAEGGAVQTVNWSITSDKHVSTSIDGSGLLTVNLAETNRTLTIRATSSADTSKFGEKTVTVPLVVNANATSLKTKFGVTSTGVTGVRETFEMVHKFIQDGGLGTAINPTNLDIKMGDYIDLEGKLTVLTYGTNVSETFENKSLNTGTLLRLIVVGINSFNAVNGNATPHVVFQFQNITATPRMSSAMSNYLPTEMRTYVTGNFLAGLKNAGVPDAVLWAPTRHVWNTISGVEIIQDKLWLPTEREMFGSNGHSNSTYETQNNQARLGYYDTDQKRIKLQSNNTGIGYWLGSPVWDRYYACVDHSGKMAYNGVDVGGVGVAPAFCVR